MLRRALAGLLVAVTSAACADYLDGGEQAAVFAANAERNQAHEGRPAGVPKAYDWHTRPRLKQGNKPGGFRAMTGWGHVFWDDDSGEAAPELSLRNMKVYMCHGELRRWHRVQSGDIYGRQFAADFKDNFSVSAQRHAVTDDVLSVAFERGTAFHFWPAMGRVALPDEPLCGFVVLVQARRTFRDGVGRDSSRGELLLGMGADYWLDKQSAWDGTGANAGIALGRLKRVSDEWAWHGLSTASDEDVTKLLSEGFTIAPW